MPTNPKPKLCVTTVPVFRVHYTVLEGYIEKVFGFEFDFLLAAGVTQGVCAEYDVTGDLPSSEWRRRADELRSGRRTKSVNLILATLANDGYIPCGKYIVTTHKPLPLTDQYTRLLRSTGDPNSPACVDFKAKNRGDSVFAQRAETIDRAWNDQKGGNA